MPIPLSKLLLDIPLFETEAYIRRPKELREEEWKNRRDYPKMPWPMNIFLLYRRAVSERAKGYAGVTNHQIISKLAAASWKNESDKIRNTFGHYAELEKEYHDKAFPDYKFNPKRSQSTKASKGKRKEENREVPNNGDDDPAYLDRNSMRKKKVKITTKQSNSAEKDAPHSKNVSETPRTECDQFPYLTNPRYLPYGGSYEQMRTKYDFEFDMKEIHGDQQVDITLSAATPIGLSRGHHDPSLGTTVATKRSERFGINAVDPNLFDIDSCGDGFYSNAYNDYKNFALSNLQHAQEEDFSMIPSQNQNCELNELSALTRPSRKTSLIR